LYRGEDRLRQTVLGNASNELRPDGIPNREQEHQKRKRFQRLRDRDPDLTD
jgi:hypothetical protein